MTADEVIELRKLWEHYSYGSFLPEATVLASRDWINYVQAMAELIPREQKLVEYPTEEEVSWAWPEGVAIVMDDPPAIEHSIISKQERPRGPSVETPPHPETQILSGLVIGVGQMMPTRVMSEEVQALSPPDGLWGIPALWIGDKPEDIVTSSWIPGGQALIQSEQKMVSESTRFFLALIHALGHRLTAQTAIPTRSRGERRRIVRELPSLRVLSLASGASVRSGEHHQVAWSHRWLVRGHWRNQAYGPQRKLRRIQWIDPFVKGPEDKPFDERRTIWKTG